MDAAIEASRTRMIEQQIRVWDVLDPRVLDALASVPRERFVPEAFRAVAFADAAIPIGHGQSMLKPALEGRILQALAPVRGERTLEIGTGTGFFAACLARMCGAVDSIEIHPDLAANAVRTLESQGVSQVSVETGDAFLREFDARYEVVAVTGAIPVRAPDFERALTIGGRMFVVVGQPPIMEACLVTRTGKETWLSESLFETVIEPLTRPAPISTFRF